MWGYGYSVTFPFGRKALCAAADDGCFRLNRSAWQIFSSLQIAPAIAAAQRKCRLVCPLDRDWNANVVLIALFY
jgi:hypothetical protein